MSKAQHNTAYQALPTFLRVMREEAGLTQRDVGAAIGRPQSWVYNCETANRRVDVTEFVLWCKACGVEPTDGFARLLGELKV